MTPIVQFLLSTCPHLQKAIRRVDRLPDPTKIQHTGQPGYISNKEALYILWTHFIEGTEKELLVNMFLRPGQSPTQINKLLALNPGKEASRRHDVKRIFQEYVKEAGVEIKCLDSTPKPSKRSKKTSDSGKKRRTLLD